MVDSDTGESYIIKKFSRGREDILLVAVRGGREKFILFIIFLPSAQLAQQIVFKNFPLIIPSNAVSRYFLTFLLIMRCEISNCLPQRRFEVKTLNILTKREKKFLMVYFDG